MRPGSVFYLEGWGVAGDSLACFPFPVGGGWRFFVSTPSFPQRE